MATLYQLQKDSECWVCEDSCHGDLCPRCWSMSSLIPKRIRRRARKGNAYYKQRLITLVAYNSSTEVASNLRGHRRRQAEHLQDMLAQVWNTGKISEQELMNLVMPEALCWLASQDTNDEMAKGAWTVNAYEIERTWEQLPVLHKRSFKLGEMTGITRSPLELGPLKRIAEFLKERKVPRSRTLKGQ